MKTNCKKLMALALAFVMVLCMLPMSSIVANAALYADAACTAHPDKTHFLYSGDSEDLSIIGDGIYYNGKLFYPNSRHEDNTIRQDQLAEGVTLPSKGDNSWLYLDNDKFYVCSGTHGTSSTLTEEQVIAAADAANVMNFYDEDSFTFAEQEGVDTFAEYIGNYKTNAGADYKFDNSKAPAAYVFSDGKGSITLNMGSDGKPVSLVYDYFGSTNTFLPASSALSEEEVIAAVEAIGVENFYCEALNKTYGELQDDNSFLAIVDWYKENWEFVFDGSAAPVYTWADVRGYISVTMDAKGNVLSITDTTSIKYVFLPVSTAPTVTATLMAGEGNEYALNGHSEVSVEKATDIKVEWENLSDVTGVAYQIHELTAVEGEEGYSWAEGSKLAESECSINGIAYDQFENTLTFEQGKRYQVTVTLSSRGEEIGTYKFAFSGAATGPAPLTFTNFSESNVMKVSLKKNGSGADNTYEYSTDGGSTWAPYTYKTSLELQGGESVSFRIVAKNSSNTTKRYDSFGVSGAGSLKITGSLESMTVRNADGSLDAYAFYKMLSTDALLKDASELVIPGEGLSEGCFHSLFYGCTALTAAPALPATTLANNCYSYMFFNCSALTAAPALPATTLAKDCYNNMFANCRVLTAAPALPAAEMAEGCYQNMFKGCRALTAAPTLASVSLAKNCYNGMFNGCVDLTAAPTLPATTLAEGCYQDMFNGCTVLAAAPALPAAVMAENCYNGMFKGCKALTTAPVLASTTLAVNCYNGMFNGCTALTTAPALPATALAEGCYNGMFSDCTALTAAPALPATTMAKECYKYMFSGCTALPTAPALPATVLAESCYSNMFNNCVKLTEAPALPATNLQGRCYESMFFKCAGLTKAPALPATTMAGSCYDGMFSECTSLTTAPALPATTLAPYCYQNMFNSCSALTKAPALPATAMELDCYASMFYRCTALTEAPALPATTLAKECYKYMFYGCEALTKAPALPATTLAESCYSYMFSDCKLLTEVTVLATDFSTRPNALNGILDGNKKSGILYLAPSVLTGKNADEVAQLKTDLNLPETWKLNIASTDEEKAIFEKVNAVFDKLNDVENELPLSLMVIDAQRFEDLVTVSVKIFDNSGAPTSYVWTVGDIVYTVNLDKDGDVVNVERLDNSQKPASSLNFTLPTPDAELKEESKVEIPASDEIVNITPTIKGNDLSATVTGNLETALGITAGEKAQGVWVWMELAESEKPDAEDAAKIEKALGGKTVGTYMDISVFKQVVGGEKQKVGELGEAVTIAVVVPENLRKDGRTFSIIYVHGENDPVEVKAESYNNENGILTFKADKFSTYALTYTDKTAGTNSDKSPATGDQNIVLLASIAFVSALAVCLFLAMTTKCYVGKYER